MTGSHSNKKMLIIMKHIYDKNDHGILIPIPIRKLGNFRENTNNIHSPGNNKNKIIGIFDG